MFRYAVPLAVSFLVLAEALAHSKLDSSNPGANAAVDADFDEVVLEFNDPVRLTLVNLRDAAGTRRELAAIPSETQARFVVAIREPLNAGAYVIEWRAIGADTHIVSGEIPFEVKPSAD
jgi:methionine-rich copper-binding protein CopC